MATIAPWLLEKRVYCYDLTCLRALLFCSDIPVARIASDDASLFVIALLLR
jgi:hypothetical protein